MLCYIKHPTFADCIFTCLLGPAAYYCTLAALSGLTSRNQVYELSISRNQVYELSISRNQVYELSISRNQVYELSISRNQVYELSISRNQVYELSIMRSLSDRNTTTVTILDQVIRHRVSSQPVINNVLFLVVLRSSRLTYLH